ncbi:class I tRNA ligase family protein [Streptomyces sp. CBMA152]|uniref:class I tRNA ligase family protein n=1 Tax=Streptomyces sp. CBMA152 TaxID=1896312 RepID=UPI0016615270|nr:class I tRNA ligase family protein [Streptomyces sp. CBMA152]MBD0743153.1 methionine--tRNA ligase [Streptomyces sp. CBMA152]
MNATTVIIAPPPTPNGNLHLGHIAGPFLAGDVYARYLRANGRPVIFTTGTDDSQTYVVSSAAKLGTTAQELCALSAKQIENTLDVMGISIDGFAAFDDGYRQTALDFLTELHAAGRFRLRTGVFPYLERTGEFLMEGLVAGDCPVCLAESRGGLCESCGHPNNFAELINPHSTIDPAEPVGFREAEILVLPMEEYRDQLTAYHESQGASWRPHLVQLFKEVLSRPLPDFPITFPTGWGIPAPFPETPGQVLNAWAEGMAASMYCTWWAQGDVAAATDEAWRAEHAAKLVYFLGFDNGYFWGGTHLALLMAHNGKYILPDTIVCNEFYELEHQKFSTSKGHVVWAEDLVNEVPRDLIRFYLSLTCPENQRTDFSRAAFEQITLDRLSTPWGLLSQRLVQRLDTLRDAGPSATSAEGRARAGAMTDRFRACFELPSYSLARAADLIVSQVQRLSRNAADPTADPGDLLLEVRTLLACASPILIDVAEQARTAGVDLGFEGGSAAEVLPFHLPVIGDAAGAAS